jgi:hypothetical protein
MLCHDYLVTLGNVKGSLTGSEYRVTATIDCNIIITPSERKASGSEGCILGCTLGLEKDYGGAVYGLAERVNIVLRNHKGTQSLLYFTGLFTK